MQRWYRKESTYLVNRITMGWMEVLFGHQTTVERSISLPGCSCIRSGHKSRRHYNKKKNHKQIKRRDILYAYFFCFKSVSNPSAENILCIFFIHMAPQWFPGRSCDRSGTKLVVNNRLSFSQRSSKADNSFSLWFAKCMYVRWKILKYY